MKIPPGFRRTGYDPNEEYMPEPVGTGTVGGLDTYEDPDNGDAKVTFAHHIYIALQIGPFVFVLGRPE